MCSITKKGEWFPFLGFLRGILAKRYCFRQGKVPKWGGERKYFFLSGNKFSHPRPCLPLLSPSAGRGETGGFRLEIPFPQKIAQAPFRGIQ
jgi:hypothetical protein